MLGSIKIMKSNKLYNMFMKIISEFSNEEILKLSEDLKEYVVNDEIL